MAYTRSRVRRTSRRKGAKRPRRSYAKKRTYRKRGGYTMSKKSLLNLTARKKRDTMMPLTNTTPTGAGNASVLADATYVNGVSGGEYLWCPTGRAPSIKTGPAGSVVNQATRTATTCFMRGVKETLKISTSSNIPWFHRRICFCSKDTTFRYYQASDTPQNTATPVVQNPVRGYVRGWINQQVNNAGNTTSAWEALIFKGTYAVDWDNLSTALVDTARIDVKFDKTTVIRSDNERGTVITRNYWHGMNKNLVYDDDEIADVTSGAVFSVDDKRGMGDYYVYDIFIPGTGGVAGDLLKVDSTTTLYWHEK
ncbi:capsid protein [Blackfly genomovirus 2]|uniref:Capsid protein n=1 Tax=Blackfly genomovirus 2 TaxID=2586201 RepID=A0A4Y5QL28_9VIRU|nr:capsid protein [Blackfly genomovirus 2]QCX35060.1 capsid protein [Blackfly genomovirus 2]